MAGPFFLSCVSWNCNSILSKILEFRGFVNEHKPDIILLQETRLESGNSFKVYGYTVYRNDNDRGTAILVKNSIPHHLILLPNLNCINATAISLNIKNLPPITVISVYVPPNRSIRNLTSDLQTLNNVSRHSIIFGDFNAHHPLWKCRRPNPHGNAIFSFTAHSDFYILAPVLATHFSSNSSSIIDFALVKGITNDMYIDSLCELNSDHNPVLLNLDLNHSPHQINKKFSPNWREFRNLLNSIPYTHPVINTCAEIDDLVKSITADISVCFEMSSKEVSAVSKSHIDSKFKNLVNIKNCARKNWQQHRTPENKNLMNRAQRALKDYLKLHSKRNWENFITSLNTTKGSIWQAAKRFKNPYRILPPFKDVSGRVYYSDSEKAELMASTFEKNFSPNVSTDNSMDNIVNSSIE